MAKIMAKKSKKTFRERFESDEKNGSFIDTLSGQTLPQLKEKIVLLSKQIGEIQKFKEENSEIQRAQNAVDAAKEILDEVLKPTKESERKEKDKLRYTTIILQDKTL